MGGAEEQRGKGAEVREAVLVDTIKGKFTSWPKGMRVKARPCGRAFLIERVKWRQPLIPLCNQCGGVPASALRFMDLE